MGKRTISTLYLKLFFIILFFIYRPLCNSLTNIQSSEILPQNRYRNVFIQNLVDDEIRRKGNTFFHIVETFTEYGLAVSPPRRRSRYSASCRRRVRCILQVPSLPSIYNVDCRSFYEVCRRSRSPTLLSPSEQSIDKSHTNEFAVAYLLEVQSTGVGVYLVCYLVDTG